MYSLIVLGFVTLLRHSFADPVVIPEYMKICSRNNPKLAECVKDSVHTLRPYLKNGIKELNVPAMEPLYIGDLNILEASAGSGINVKVKKLNISGASNFEIRKMRVSNHAQRFDFELNLPRLEGAGNYTIDGRILALPITGAGPFTGTFINFYAYVKVQFRKKLVNDIDYIELKDLTVRVRTGKGRIHLKNLFNGDDTLGDIINETINQNFELFTNEVIGPIERALENRFSDITSKILENFTYNDVFPE